MKKKKDRINTVCYSRRNNKQTPTITLAGKWLKEAGFDGGVKFKVFSAKGLLLLIDTGKRAGQA